MIADMPRNRPPFVQREVSRHGKTTWYFRRGDGPRTRLHGEYQSPEWWADYDAALAGTKIIEPVRSQAGTLRWLVARYQDSAVYSSLSEATRRQRKSIYKRMIDTGGDSPLSAITKKVIIEGRDRRSDTPAAAVCFVKAVRAMFRWAVEAELMAADPTIGVRASDPKTDGHHTWTIDEVRQFGEKFPLGTMPRLALDLMLFTGMRRSDAVLFGRQHIRGDIFEYRSLKTGVEVVAPVLEPLRESIEATGAAGRMTFLVTEFGTPFSSSNSFGNWFRKRCIEAGVPGRAHGLRKAGATIAAENGATDRELMALFGWESVDHVGTYTRKADRAKLANEAAQKLKAGTSIPAPCVPVRGPERKRDRYQR